MGVADEALFPRVFPITDETVTRDLIKRKRVLFRSAMASASPVPPETVELVRELSREYPLAVVSSSARAEVAPPLERAGVLDCFQALLTLEDVERLKPAPDPYLKAARMLAAKRPLVVEDSASGIASARAAGFELVEIAKPQDVAAAVRKRLLHV